MYAIFRTPTILDLRGIMTFGLNAKPNTTSPIGYFGTGLKMAIAATIRMGGVFELSVDQNEYSFYTSREQFRNQEFDFVRMKARKFPSNLWRRSRLPYTTQLAKNWKLWQVFRELYSNTIDEGGTFEFRHIKPEPFGNPGETVIVLGMLDGLEEICAKPEMVFLQGGERAYSTGSAFQIFHKPSNYIYYRGIRVMELKKPSIMTYNILQQQQLTEDRSLAEEFWLPYTIAKWVTTQTDRAVINHFLNATEDHWEYELPFDSDYVAHVDASEEFKSCLRWRTTLKPAPRGFAGGHVPIPIWSSPRTSAFLKRMEAPVVVEIPLSQRYLNWWGSYPDTMDKSLLEEVADYFRGV